MHKSEPRVNPTLIDCTIKIYELEGGLLEPIEVLPFLESNFDADLTSRYKESTTFQYLLFTVYRLPMNCCP